MPKPKSIKVTKVCEVCKKTFIHPVWNNSPNVGRFCSWLCRCSTGVKKKCPVCNIDMTVTQWENKRNPDRCCSMECRKKRFTGEDRFWWYAVKKEGCWGWTGRKGPRGYGYLLPDGYNPVRAHRFSWEMHNGPIPDGLCVLHKCDNPPCTNPDHLFLGTHKDNAQDKVSKGRCNSAKGSRLKASKLTEAIVKEARTKYANGSSQKELATLYGVDQSAISCAVRRKTWKHVV